MYIRFGDLLWSVNQLPTQEVNNLIYYTYYIINIHCENDRVVVDVQAEISAVRNLFKSFKLYRKKEH